MAPPANYILTRANDSNFNSLRVEEVTSSLQNSPECALTPLCLFSCERAIQDGFSINVPAILHHKTCGVRHGRENALRQIQAHHDAHLITLKLIHKIFRALEIGAR